MTSLPTLLPIRRRFGVLAATVIMAATGLGTGLASAASPPAEEVIRRLLTLSGYHKHLESDAKGSGEDRLANVDELVSAAREFDHSVVLVSVGWWIAVDSASIKETAAKFAMSEGAVRVALHRGLASLTAKLREQ